MIAVDIETTGEFFPHKRGIWQIGAIDLDNPKNQFMEEAKIDESDEIDNEALLVIGKTESYLRNNNKQTQKELLRNFFDWAKKIKDNVMICDNPQYDFSFIRIKAKIYGLDFPFSHKCIDLHSIAQLKFHQINKKFKTKILNNKITSDLSMPNLMSFCGLEDKRIQVEIGENKVKKNGSYHNGLEDAKIVAECFSRIVYGKSLLKEYNKIPLPNYLR
jgi:DNA polymerase III epsilon subunit-like protein